MHVSGEREPRLQRYEKIEFLGEGQVRFHLAVLYVCLTILFCNIVCDSL